MLNFIWNLFFKMTEYLKAVRCSQVTTIFYLHFFQNLLLQMMSMYGTNGIDTDDKPTENNHSCSITAKFQFDFNSFRLIDIFYVSSTTSVTNNSQKHQIFLTEKQRNPFQFSLSRITAFFPNNHSVIMLMSNSSFTEHTTNQPITRQPHT